MTDDTPDDDGLSKLLSPKSHIIFEYYIFSKTFVVLKSSFYLLLHI